MVKVQNIKEGDVYKSYRQVCYALGEEIKSSNSKVAQIKEWSRYFSYHRQGNKFIIDKIYDVPKEKLDGRGGANNRVREPLSITSPELTKEWLVDKNGFEINDDITRTSKEEYWWLCSTCKTEVFASPEKRLNKTVGKNIFTLICPYCSLSSGESKVYKWLRSANIPFSQQYMFNDLIGLGGKLLRYDFAVYHSDDLVLVEYDGEFHYKELNPDPEKFKILAAHDEMKNKYCKDNGIPLLRISYKDKGMIEDILEDYFINYRLFREDIVKYKTERVIKEINKRKEEVQKLNEEITNLQKIIIKYHGKEV